MSVIKTTINYFKKHKLRALFIVLMIVIVTILAYIIPLFCQWKKQMKALFSSFLFSF